MEIEVMKKLLMSSSVDDIKLGLEILHKKSTKYIEQVVKELEGKNSKREKDRQYTYFIEIENTGIDTDVYITKGRYYCAIYTSGIYIDHYKLAKKRIALGDSTLSVSLQDEK